MAACSRTVRPPKVHGLHCWCKTKTLTAVYRRNFSNMEHFNSVETGLAEIAHDSELSSGLYNFSRLTLFPPTQSTQARSFTGLNVEPGIDTSICLLLAMLQPMGAQARLTFEKDKPDSLRHLCCLQSPSQVQIPGEKRHPLENLIFYALFQTW